MSTGLRLRPLMPADESVFRTACQELAVESFEFGHGWHPESDWRDYLAKLERIRLGVGLAANQVPATFLLADVDGVVVGRTSIRHRLNDQLRNKGGHIGYAVRPGHRRLGYGTEILRQSLIVARSVGVGTVLVTCDKANTASAEIIEACGGTLASQTSTHLRYRIP